jgi:hypothetical protein
MAEIRSMRPIEVADAGDGVVVLRQSHGHPQDADVIELTRDQLPLVIQWLREGAGLGDEEAGAPPPPDEIRQLARRVRRLEDAAREGGADAGVLEALRVALEWAAGDAELSPRDWLRQRGTV